VDCYRDAPEYSAVTFHDDTSQRGKSPCIITRPVKIDITVRPVRTDSFRCC